MPVPEHALAQVRGRIGLGGEEWTCSLRFDVNSGPLDLGSAQAMADDIFDDFDAFMVEVQGTARAASLTEVRVYDIATNGQSKDDPAISDREPQVPSGAFGYPPQTSLTITLDTEGRSRPRYGRFYLPWLRAPQVEAFTLGPDGRLRVDGQTAIADAAALLVTNLNNWPGVEGLNGRDPQLVIVSPTFGTMKPVTQVRVGRCLDTMRSRRRQLEEDYQQRDISGG